MWKQRKLAESVNFDSQYYSRQQIFLTLSLRKEEGLIFKYKINNQKITELAENLKTKVTLIQFLVAYRQNFLFYIQPSPVLILKSIEFLHLLVLL